MLAVTMMPPAELKPVVKRTVCENESLEAIKSCYAASGREKVIKFCVEEVAVGKTRCDAVRKCNTEAKQDHKMCIKRVERYFELGQMNKESNSAMG